MPLYDEGPSRIRMNLQALQEGKKPCVVAIGTLTESQLTAINASRASQGYPPIQAEILFLGRHVYKSRVLGDGYTIEDVIDQIASALHRESVALEAPKMTTMENPVPRNDRYGNAVGTGQFWSVPPGIRKLNSSRSFPRATTTDQRKSRSSAMSGLKLSDSPG
jgi:hypothetical protein